MSQLVIKRLGHLGHGIADGPDGDIFIPYTLPDEEIEGQIDAGRIANPRILTPSPDRIAAPCSHFKSCGGCALQHAKDEFVASWKTEIVKSALAAHGIHPPIRPIETSSAFSRRRASLAGRRTKKGAIVGFHAKAAETILPIPNCTLLHPDIIAAIPSLEGLTILGASRKGSVSIAVARSESGLDVDVNGAKHADGPLLATLGVYCDQHQFARLSWNGEVVATRIAPTQKFGPARVIPPPGAFLQATCEGQDFLTTAILEILRPAQKVVDLFAGCGTFSLPIAEFANVHAVEGEQDLLDALLDGHRKTPTLKPLTIETRDLFRRPLMADELNKFDAVVIDPPRAGSVAQTTELAKSAIANIAFVSCNPITFARDALILVESGYKINWVVPVDQFRWSPHIELVASLSRT